VHELIDLAHPLAAAVEAEAADPARDHFLAGFIYSGDFPAGPIAVDIQSIWVRLQGHWRTQ